MRPALAESRLFTPLDQQRMLRGLTVDDLRTRGTRGVRTDFVDARKTAGLTTDLLKTDAEPRGEGWLHTDKIEVRPRVVDRRGRRITAAAADIPTVLFPGSLFTPPPPRPATANLA